MIDFGVTLQEISGVAGSTTEAHASLENNQGLEVVGYSTDFTVPDGVTIAGIMGEDLVDGTERPDEGCTLVTPQRVECHTNATLGTTDNTTTIFEIELADDAAGVVGAATYSVTADEGGSETAEADVTVHEGVVDLEVAFDPLIGITAPPGADFEHTVRIRNVGNTAMAGASIDFQPGQGVTVTGVSATGLSGLELVDGTERPDEGCAVVDTHVECHTNATLAAPGTAEVTFQMRMPESAPSTGLGDTTVRVIGDNGGDGADATSVGLDVDLRMLDVTATPSVSGAAGDVVEIVVTARNNGVVPVTGRLAELAVPAGATITGVEGLDVLDEMTWVDEGCVQPTPQEASCLRLDSLAPGDVEEWTFQVRLDDDAPVGELGVAALHYEGYSEDYEAETVVTVTGAGDDTGGDGEELPDTGTSSTTVALAAMGLLLTGAVVALRARRA
ncbi:LPXTG cell wall anchor domain-containing protein [Jiangella ureilytica]|uniref:LPXTG cell wall anchor domain-containing protein n=1 Tax=Jiangella ureilytica TaxID=2530374 RepID=A0A4V2XXB5_9ACTN|nr:LPXTG cell wall anchor domain-containing protein [Jiangella ureilytica]TDC52575.1 LPXTG cell wall anchor domain-containing protein [Jiangella ureilytica]